MAEPNFHILVYPKTFRVAGEPIVRYFIWCEWLRASPAGREPRYVSEPTYLEPHCPCSFLLHGVAQRNGGYRLAEIPEESRPHPRADDLRLAGAVLRVARLRYARAHTRPDLPDETRTQPVALWCPTEEVVRPWSGPVLGADFFVEHRLRLYIDYDWLRVQSTDKGLRFNSLVPCGFLELPGDSSQGDGDEPPDDGSDNSDPVTGIARGVRSLASLTAR